MPFTPHPLDALASLARWAAARGWAPATSGNFSCRLDDGRFAVTASGHDKLATTVADLVIVDGAGRSQEPERGRPSAETAIHLALYRLLPDAAFIAHTHSATVVRLSARHAAAGGFDVGGYELLKALPDVGTHEYQTRIPIFANTQRPEELAPLLAAAVARAPLHGFMIERHGSYCWGGSAADTRRHLEALELLYHCELEARSPA